MVSVKEAYKKGAEILGDSLDARVLLEHLLECESGKLPLFYDRILTDAEEIKYQEFIEKRKENMPVSYITNKKEFYSLEFYVKEGVLIPRFDTEILVSEALKYAKKDMHIADLCCGSGCIGISIAKNVPDSFVELYDISDVAVEVANINTQKLGIKNASVQKADILKDELIGKFDIIVSNPPYIPEKDIDTLMEDVRDYEPKEALTDGGDGLLFYKRLKEICDNHLTDKGMLFAEIGINQENDVKNIFKTCRFVNDLAGIPRVMIYEIN